MKNNPLEDEQPLQGSAKSIYGLWFVLHSKNVSSDAPPSHRGQICHLKKHKAHISIPYSSVTIMMMVTVVTMSQSWPSSGHGVHVLCPNRARSGWQTCSSTHACGIRRQSGLLCPTMVVLVAIRRWTGRWQTGFSVDGQTWPV